MRAALDCYPCFLRQALQAARFAGADEDCQGRVVDLALGLLREMPDRQSPLAAASAIYAMVCRETGNPDPYQAAKAEGSAEALRWLPGLRESLGKSDDPLGFALKAAVAGNLMDYGPFARFEVSTLLEQLQQHEFAIDDRRDPESRLTSARRGRSARD